MAHEPRHVLLEARVGAVGERRRALAPGQKVKIGRTSLSDFQIPEDDSLSQEHWELSWDGSVCEVRDLGSALGTMVGGVRRDRATVGHGAWIRAGMTDFSVYFEPAADGAPRLAAAPDEASRAAAVLATLGEASRDATLFAVLDAARTDRILSLLRTAADDFVSLYDGVRSAVDEDGAPYLVRFANRSRLLPRLVVEGWGDAWGIYFTTTVPLRDARAHLRRLLVVTRDADDLPMYFRFYDPRVLRAFLPIATPRQKTAFFGPIDRFLAEEAGGDSALSFTASQERA